MSPTLRERTERWQAWLDTVIAPEGYVMRAVEHWCGTATVVTHLTGVAAEELAFEFHCEGCRSQPREPWDECQPLFGREVE